jgi:hypothetical protein
MDERLEAAFPNVFYDLIVFVAPSVLLMTGVVAGLGGWPLVERGGIKVDIGATDVLIILLIFVFLGYEYGRLAEALSETLVGRPLRLLSARQLAFRSCDFNAVLTGKLPIDAPAENRKGSKWTIYFFATLVAPDIGRDLLKRYAWEKLSRSSAMTFALLLTCSVILLVLRFTSVADVHALGAWGFGSIRYTAALAVLTMATYYEYYKRNCWNNDLLCKTLPVLLYACQNKGHGNDRPKVKS